MIKESKVHNEILISTGYSKRRKRRIVVCLILSCITLILMACMLMLGNTFYPIDTILKVLMGEEIKGASFAINTIRLPRMLAAVLSGIAFGMAGNAFQTMLRNPLASPDIIGVTSGSSVAAVFCILVLHLSGSVVSIASVICGLVIAAVIYVLSKGGSFSGGRLILIGIGVQAMLQAVISYMLLKASQYDVPGAMRWLSGSLNGMQMNKIAPLFFVVCIAGTMLVIFSEHLKILELGEQSAITLGLKTDQTRVLMVISAVCLIAFATAVTGPISFVAFLSGPIAKKIVGHGNSSAICSGLVGAILVLGADLIGQYAFSTRYTVGVITGILGAPYLIFLLIQMNKRGESA
ncbi:FecCD family ABC transporter permease [Anaerosporobacter sp.]